MSTSKEGKQSIQSGKFEPWTYAIRAKKKIGRVNNYVPITEPSGTPIIAKTQYLVTAVELISSKPNV